MPDAITAPAPETSQTETAPAAAIPTDPTRPDTSDAAADAPRARINELVGALAAAREALDAAERRHGVDLALVRAGTIDLETARLLAERSLAHEPGADAEGVVRSLRAAKPHLFAPSGVAGTPEPRRRQSLRPGAMGASPAREEPAEVRASADEARTTGDRGALMRYLRARRPA